MLLKVMVVEFVPTIPRKLVTCALINIVVPARLSI